MKRWAFILIAVWPYWDGIKRLAVILIAVLPVLAALVLLFSYPLSPGSYTSGYGYKMAVPYYNRAITLEKQGDRDSAIANYDLAIRFDPNYANAYVNRGHLFQIRGDLDRAIADYDRGLRLHPGDGIAYRLRGEAWYDKGDRDRAVADFDQARLRGS